MSLDTPACNACIRFEADLEDFLNGTLHGPALELLRAHLPACGVCRQALENARPSGALLRTALHPAAPLNPGFVRRVMAAIRVAEDRRHDASRLLWSPVEALAARLALAAALALAVMAVFVVRDSYRSNSVASSGGPVVEDVLFAPASAPVSGDDVLLAMAPRDHGK
jgi:hypothetical protein